MEKAPLYIAVMHRIIAHISGSGWLPPERQLCQDLGISRGTLRKAVDLLIKEGRIISHPRQGNYLSGVKPPCRIGIIEGDGGSSPQLWHPHILSGELQVIGNRGALVRMLNPGSSPEKIIRRYNLDGVIWNNPPASAFPLIREIIESREIPLTVPILMFTRGGDRIPLHHNLITLDYAAIGRSRAEYFLSAGHTRVAYLGDDDDAVTVSTFRDCFKRFGIEFNPEWHLKDVAEIPERLPELLTREAITGIVSNGGADRLELLFRELNRLPNAEAITVLPDWINELPDLMSRYPRVRVSTVNRLPYWELGETAASTLFRQLQTHELAPQILLETLLQGLTYKDGVHLQFTHRS